MRLALYLTLLVSVIMFLSVSPRIRKEWEWQRQDREMRSKLDRMTREADQAVTRRGKLP